MNLLRLIVILAFGLLFCHTSPAQTSENQSSDTSQEKVSYSGPSLLSRGLRGSSSARNADIAFQPHLGANAVCDSGLTAPSVDSQGHLPNVFQCGVEATAGINGYHRWRRTSLGLTYTGNYRHYFHNSFYDGSDQILGLDLNHELSKSLRLTLREAAGTFSRSYGIGPGSVYFDPGSLLIPNTEVFDDRVFYASTTMDLRYTPSVRWSFNFGGEGDVVRRRSGILYGVVVGSAHADAVYRYSRFGSIGISYQFSQFSFTKAFGSSDIHIAGIQYAVRMSRSWQFALQVGAGRVESLAHAVTQVDPAIAAITGQTQAVVALYRVNYVPSVAASLTKSFRNAGLSFNYTRGISPGNGVYVTSSQESGGVYYNYNGLRQWAFSASAGYSRLVDLVQTLGHFRTYVAGASVSRKLTGGLSLSARVEGNRYSVDTSGGFHRNAYRLALGFVWSPGDIPVTLW